MNDENEIDQQILSVNATMNFKIHILDRLTLKVSKSLNQDEIN